jgi:hypothetical protein
MLSVVGEDVLYSFRGTLLSSSMVHKPPFDHVEVTARAITLRPLWGEPLRIERADIEAIEFERVRLPLNWTTPIYFVLRNGSRTPKFFVTLRTRSFRSSLEDLGWPTRDRTPRTMRHPNGGRDRWY